MGTKILKRIFITAILFFLGQTIFGQEKIEIRPHLGLQTAFARKVSTEVPSYVKLKLNKIDVELDIGIRTSVFFENKSSLFLSIGTAISGYNIGFLHPYPCNEYAGTYSERFRSSSASYYKIALGFQSKLQKRKLRSKNEVYLGIGLGFDFRGNEDLNNGNIIVEGINRCGKIFKINSYSHSISKTGFTFPISFIYQMYAHNKRPSLAVGMIYNFGLSTHFIEDLFYSVDNNSYLTRLKIKGSSFGLNLSYPIRF